jgi:hypothetical protein
MYTKFREITSRGPYLTTAEFQRLNEDSQHRLLIFDIFGKDGYDLYSPLLAVPSDDISPTQDQIALYKLNSAKNKDTEFENRVPLLTELLHTGLIPTDYVISTGGPLVFENDANPWGALWELLNKFSGVSQFAYPADNHCRYPNRYRVTLRELHQCLVNKYARISIEPLVKYTSEEDGGEE